MTRPYEPPTVGTSTSTVVALIDRTGMATSARSVSVTRGALTSGHALISARITGSKDRASIPLARVIARRRVRLDQPLLRQPLDPGRPAISRSKTPSAASALT